jgi:hypothetical protein
MPDVTKPTRYFDAETGLEINEPQRFANISKQDLAQLTQEYPGINPEEIRFYTKDNNGTIKPFKYKNNKTLVEKKVDCFDLGFKIAFERDHRESSVYCIISPMFYYSNDFSDVKEQSFAVINSEKFGSIILPLFFGSLITWIGASTVKSIVKSIDYKTLIFRGAILDSSFDTFATFSTSIALTTMIYKMHADQAATYLEITEDEYLELRKLYPAIDCDDLLITHPIKKQFLKTVKYFGISLVIATMFYTLKWYKSSKKNNCPQLEVATVPAFALFQN